MHLSVEDCGDDQVAGRGIERDVFSPAPRITGTVPPALPDEFAIFGQERHVHIQTVHRVWASAEIDRRESGAAQDHAVGVRHHGGAALVEGRGAVVVRPHELAVRIEPRDHEVAIAARQDVALAQIDRSGEPNADIEAAVAVRFDAGGDVVAGVAKRAQPRHVAIRVAYMRCGAAARPAVSAASCSTAPTACAVGEGSCGTESHDLVATGDKHRHRQSASWAEHLNQRSFAPRAASTHNRTTAGRGSDRKGTPPAIVRRRVAASLLSYCRR